MNFNKLFLAAFYAVSFSVFACSDDGISLVTHGGEIYDTVIIGKQTWLKRNLNYAPTDTDVATNFRCYEDNENNCDKYGRLYDWATVMALPASCNRGSCANMVKTPHKGICPAGYHIPTNADWDKLFRYVDGNVGTESPYKSDIAGKYLKTISDWNEYEGTSGNSENTYGFSALPGGTGYPDGYFYNVGNSGYWWSASEINSYNAFRRGMFYDKEGIDHYSYGKNLLLSVRCVRD
jgi:uncharacterized protein (TIGR02145 family)